MKRTIYLFLLPLLALLGSCDKMEDIVFDVEQPQFEIKANAILLEVIMPIGSAADDSYYIVGDFNGGEAAAVGNSTWKLEKAANSDTKWGIYLTPDSFVSGKTLADGFYFVSAAQGVERSVKNEPVKHVLNAKVGTRTNVFVDRWAKYFEVPDKGGHDGNVVYIQNSSSWTALALYGYDSKNKLADTEIFGAWPGKQPDGTEVINGKTFTYFDLGKDKADLTGINLIVNNNNGGSQFDVATIDFNTTYYYRLTDAGISTVDPNASYRIYVNDLTGWDALTLSIGGANWPGMTPKGTYTQNGVTYQYFETSTDLIGQSIELWFNNGKETSDPGIKQSVTKTITFTRDYYFSLTANGISEIDPTTYGKSYSIYIENLSGWDGTLYLYGYSDGNPQLGNNVAWPGLQPAETVEIGGINYLRYQLAPANTGLSYNLMPNDNNNNKLDQGGFTIDHDLYLKFTGTELTEVSTSQQ
jgi:hypothetical protein